MRVACVTGCDGNFFWHLLLLLQSFKVQCPGRHLHVCDYGLSEPQRRFIARHATLLDRPEILAGTSNQWRLKSSLSLFTQGLDYDHLVWLDADTMLLADVPGLLSGIALQGGFDICAPLEPFTFADIEKLIRDQQGAEQSEIFATRYHAAAIAPDRRYINAGTFLSARKSFLDEYCAMTLEIPRHLLFEQNCFNICANRYLVGGLDRAVFNLSQELLDDAHPTPDGQGLRNAQEAQVALLHFTSGTGNLTEGQYSFDDNDGRRMSGTMRLVTNPHIKPWQSQVFALLRANMAELAEDGLLV